MKRFLLCLLFITSFGMQICAKEIVSIKTLAATPQIEEQDGIKCLDLRDCGLTTLKGIKLIEGIEEAENIYLMGNELTSVKQLKVCKNLKRLWLGHNNLIKLPKGLLDLKQLIKLCLDNNHLKDIKGIEKLKNLEEKLCLRSNELENLYGIEKLKKLQALDIRDNNLSNEYMDDVYENIEKSFSHIFTVDGDETTFSTEAWEYWKSIDTTKHVCGSCGGDYRICDCFGLLNGEDCGCSNDAWDDDIDICDIDDGEVC